MRIIVIEHEHKTASAIRRGLERLSHSVNIAFDSADGWLQAKTGDYDFIIADLMLPGKPDTASHLRKLRSAGVHTPVLVLVAKSKISDAPTQLAAGADDFLVKPFALSELTARLEALAGSREKADDRVLEYGDLKLDSSSFLAKRGSKTIVLTSREFALLEYLMRNADKTVTKEDIISHVWNYESGIRPNTLEVYIGYLRSKIDDPFKGPNLIGTRRGFGYYLGKLQ